MLVFTVIACVPALSLPENRVFLCGHACFNEMEIDNEGGLARKKKTLVSFKPSERRYDVQLPHRPRGCCRIRTRCCISLFQPHFPLVSLPFAYKVLTFPLHHLPSHLCIYFLHTHATVLTCSLPVFLSLSLTPRLSQKNQPLCIF